MKQFMKILIDFDIQNFPVHFSCFSTLILIWAFSNVSFLA